VAGSAGGLQLSSHPLASRQGRGRKGREEKGRRGRRKEGTKWADGMEEEEKRGGEGDTH